MGTVQTDPPKQECPDMHHARTDSPTEVTSDRNKRIESGLILLTIEKKGQELSHPQIARRKPQSEGSLGDPSGIHGEFLR